MEQVTGFVTSESAIVEFPPTGRVEGFDLARAVAVFGMVMVNYYVIFSSVDAFPRWYTLIADHLIGRAAVLFVMLAGIGLVLIAQRAAPSYRGPQMRKVRMILFKRSIVLLLMGALFMRYWGADILHFYGLFLTAGAFLLSASGRRLWGLALSCLLISTLLFCMMDGEPGIQEWIREPMPAAGIIDDFLFSGHYPAFPWLAFLFIGMWMGKHGVLSREEMKRKMLLWAGVVFLAVELLGRYAPGLLIDRLGVREGSFLDILFISNVFPMSPIFSISAAASSVIVIISALTIIRCPLFSRAAGVLARTGRLSLTIYIVHVFIGIGVYNLTSSLSHNGVYRIMTLSLTFGFCLTSIFAANLWFKYFSQGPFEWVLRRSSRSA